MHHHQDKTRSEKMQPYFTLIWIYIYNKINEEVCIQDVPLQRPLAPLYPQVETNHFYVDISAQQMKVDIKMTASSGHFFIHNQICR